MKTLYLDCNMGAAGDMLSAALLELLPPEERPGFIDELNALGIPGVEFTAQPSVKCGITGTHMEVSVNGHTEGEEHHHEHEHHEHEHHHEHGHTHGHHHSGMHDIEHIVSGHLNVSEKVKSDVLAHGVPVTEIHFHEVGAMDAVADVTAVCLLMDRLSPEQVIVSPVHVGSGQVRCAHGILPVPAPATAHILTGVPIYGGEIEGELCTPTGAALLKHFATKFGGMPIMTLLQVGYGMGSKDFEAANCVRAMLGEA